MKSVTEVRRWATLRCTHCGHRFRWSRDARHSYGNRDGKVYHGPCIAYVEWHKKAEERLDVLALVMGAIGLVSHDIEVLAELRSATEDERIATSNRTWRVLYDLGKRAMDRENGSCNE